MIGSIHKVARFMARFLVFLFTGLAFVAALVIALSQMDPVRVWLLEKGLTALNDQLQARIEIGSVSGNLITGLSLHQVRVIADSTTLLSAPDVDLRYQLRPYFRDKIIGVSVVIHQPEIRLIRNQRDSVWNFARITRPTQVTDSVVTPFPYTIEVHGFEIKDGTFYFHDLTQPNLFDTTTRSINYSYLDLENFNLSAQAHIEPTSQSLWLQNLYFDMPRHDLKVLELSGHFALDTTGATVDDMRLETTRTLFDLSARLDSVNFFAPELQGPEGWKHYPMELTLDAERISTMELKRFLPDLAFLGGVPALELEVGGTYGDFAIKRLELDLANSDISITGRLKNLDHPDTLHIDARINDSRLSYADVPIYVPGLGIPDLSYLGRVELRSAEFIGYPQTFSSSIDVTTAVGSARGAGWMDLRDDVVEYRYNMATVHANLAPIVGDPSLKSDLNGWLVASGRGFTLEDLNTSFRFESESSTIGERSYRKVIAAGSMRESGFTMVDTLLAAWGPTGTPDTRAILASAPGNVEEFRREDISGLLTGRVRLSAAEASIFANNPSLTLGGRVDLRDRDTPRYKVTAQGRRFSLTDILPDVSTTRFTFTLEGSGVGTELDDLQGEAHVRVIDAELSRGRRFNPFEATVALTKQGPEERTLTLRSDLADLDLAGRWNFDAVIRGIGEGIDALADYVQRKTGYQQEDLFAIDERPFSQPVNATYDLQIKNLQPLDILLDDATIAATGDLRGEISGTSQLMSITAQGGFRDFLYQQDSLRIRLLATQLQIELRNIVPGRVDDITSMMISIRTDSLAQYGTTTFNAPRIEASLDEGEFRVSGATGINGKISMAVSGVVNTNDPAGYRVMLDTVRIGLPNDIRWRNRGPIRALIGENEIMIDSLMMQRNNAEVISVTGRLIEGNQFDNVQLTASSAYIRDFAPFFAGSEAYSTVSMVGGWLRELRLRVNGSLDAPVIDGTFAVDSLSYTGAFIGNLLADIHYADRNVSGVVMIDDVLLPIGTEEENQQRMAGHVTDINRVLGLLNRSLKDSLTPLGPPTDRARLLTELRALTPKAAAINTRVGNDTLGQRLSWLKNRLIRQIANLRSVAEAEGQRLMPGDTTLTARIDINQLPIDLSLDATDRLIAGRPVDIKARTDSLPIAFLAPILSGVQIRGGTADLSFTVSGSFPDLVYSGEGLVERARVLVEGNNMLYSGDAKLTFREQVLRIENMVVRNDPRDLPNGRARVTGTIRFDGFSLQDLNLTATTEQFMVLSDATQAVNDLLYGDLVIASGVRPLRFSGTLDRPRLSGDVTIINANLRMEQRRTDPVVGANPANYVDLERWLERVGTESPYGPPLPQEMERRLGTIDSLQATLDTAAAPGSLEENFARVQERIRRVQGTRVAVSPSLADALLLDLNVTIAGRVFLTIDFSPIEQLRAELGSDQREITVRRGNDGEMNIIGSVEVLNGSKYIFIKTFDATGALTFSGDIQNTKLGIRAEHNGRRLRADNETLQEYQVIINITGTLETPVIQLTYTIDGQPPTSPDQDTRSRNAISLLLFSRTTEELAGTGLREQVGDLSSSIVGSGTSSVASRILTDILAGGTEFIRSIDIDLSGRPTNVGQARLNIVSQFGRVIIRVGGQISDPVSNGTVVIELPLSVFFDIDFLRKLSIQIERAAESVELNRTGTSDIQNEIYRLRLQYRELW